MKTSPVLLLLLAAGALHARTYVPSPSNDEPRLQPGTTVQGGEIVVKASTNPLLPPGLLRGTPDAPLASIELKRDFKDSPPDNLVRGTLEDANGEND